MSKNVLPKVLVTFDSMKYPNTGLFHFGKSLGKALIIENKPAFLLNYYIDKNATEYFNGPELIQRTKLHKIWFSKYRKFELVHFSDQYCRLNVHKFGGKKVMTIHDLNQLHEENISTERKKRYMVRMNSYINACRRIVAISNFVADDILANFPQAANKLSVIYNGADKPVVPAGHVPVYEPKKPFLYAIGILSAKKNFHVLPPLLQGNDMELIISGIETPYKETIIKEARKFGCLHRLKITGPVSDEDKAWYYKNCQAFVFPSLAEGFGLPVIEAMYFGKPVFLSTYTSLPEIGADNAWYFDSFEPRAMQAVFNKGMEEFKTKGLSASIVEHANKFDWRQTAKKYLELYMDILQ